MENSIGQHFIIGIPGAEIDRTTESLISEIQPGGFCFFSRNIKTSSQTRQLTDHLRKLCDQPPIISIDQEGGLVDRLRRLITPMPSVSEISSLPTGDEVSELASVTSQILTSLGFNVNYAPVVDVLTDSRGTHLNGLTSRIFGKGSEEVIGFARMYLNSLQKNGCIGTLKHFPGLGASQIDSHEDLPVVDVSPLEFEEIDLPPFARLISSDSVHAVMIGHAAYPQLEWQEMDVNNQYLPSSLSYNVVTKLLRRELGFKGLIVSDDLEMGAIINNYGIGAASVKAIQAGIDMVLICNSSEKIREGYQAVKAAVRSGEITTDTLDESLERIANFKKLLPAPTEYAEGQFVQFSERIAALNAKVRKSV